MLVLTGQDVIEYMPVIKEYSGYDRDNTVFDDYILSVSDSLINQLLINGIDGTIDDIQNNPLFKELNLKTIVCKYYKETSYNIDEDKVFIDYICNDAKDYLNSFIKSILNNGTPDKFDGTITTSFSG